MRNVYCVKYNQIGSGKLLSLVCCGHESMFQLVFAKKKNELWVLSPGTKSKGTI